VAKQDLRGKLNEEATGRFFLENSVTRGYALKKFRRTEDYLEA